MHVVSDRLTRLTRQLDAIEAELRKLGWWEEAPPDLIAAADRDEIRNFLDVPSFELWLQALFLPRAREAVAANDLPAESQVGQMALRQYDYHSVVPEAAHLLALLHDFDALVEGRKPIHRTVASAPVE